MNQIQIKNKLNDEPDTPRVGVFQGVDVVKVRECIQEGLDDLESALEMLNHAVNPILPNPNYLLCSYVDLKNALEKVQEAMKELEKAEAVKVTYE
jgi:tetratricopeptide (TPR) repeat protein